MSVSVRVDLRSQLGAVRCQGRRPTCIAFAASDCHAAARGVPFLELSTEYAFYHALRRKGEPIRPDSGVPLCHMLAAIRYDGQPAETEWPYLPDLPEDLSNYRPPSSITSVFRRDGKLAGISATPICDSLDKGRAPLVAFWPTLQFLHATANQVVRADAAEKPSSTAHAVVAVGWGEEQGERVVLVRNSWGAGWAGGGHAWLAEGYLTPRSIAVVVME